MLKDCFCSFFSLFAAFFSLFVRVAFFLISLLLRCPLLIVLYLIGFMGTLKLRDADQLNRADTVRVDNTNRISEYRGSDPSLGTTGYSVDRPVERRTWINSAGFV